MVECTARIPSVETNGGGEAERAGAKLPELFRGGVDADEVAGVSWLSGWAQLSDNREYCQ